MTDILVAVLSRGLLDPLQQVGAAVNLDCTAAAAADQQVMMLRPAAPVQHPAAPRPHHVRLADLGQFVQHPVNRPQAAALTPGAKRPMQLPGRTEPAVLAEHGGKPSSAAETGARVPEAAHHQPPPANSRHASLREACSAVSAAGRRAGPGLLLAQVLQFAADPGKLAFER